jgi:hypothetical protein
MGFPSRRSRSRITSRAVGEIIVQEWKGDGIEKALVMIHPERFKTAEQVALSLMLLVGDEVYGSRRHAGSLTLGIQLDKETGSLGYSPDEQGAHAKKTLNNVLKQVGTLPEGHVELPEPKAVQRSRQRKYVCPTCSTIIRAGSDGLEAACLHAGTEHAGEGAAVFALQLPKVKEETEMETTAKPKTKTVKAVVTSAEAPLSQRQNIANLGALVAAGAAKVAGSAPRAFGQG